MKNQINDLPKQAFHLSGSLLFFLLYYFPRALMPAGQPAKGRRKIPEIIVSSEAEHAVIY